MFIGREYEINELNKEYESGKFGLSIIYGRRRVGKTYLIEHFLENKKGAYFVATESNESINLDIISKSIYHACNLPNNLPSFNSFEEGLDFLFNYSTEHRIVFVIDEYPYIAQSSPYFSSLLQGLIDKYKNKSKLFLILCGSSMSFMENQVLSVKSPLYGRRTSSYKIKPFNYLESSYFVPKYSYKDKAIVYALTGGVAEYLTFFDDEVTLKENIIINFLSPNGRLMDEPGNLLKQEMREPGTYNDIIYAISQGASKLNEIATKTSIASGGLNHYINSLIDLGILSKKIPVGEKNFRRPIYIIKDFMFRFWFKFVQPNINLISLNLGEKVYDNFINAYLNEYMGHIFEDMSLEYLEILLMKNKIDFIPKEYGNWWGTDNKNKIQVEIDWVAFSKDKTIYTECKWKNEKVNETVLEELKNKSALINAIKKEFWIFSLSGFTFKESDIRDNKGNNSNVRLFSLENLYEV